MFLIRTPMYGQTRGVRRLGKPTDFGSPDANRMAHLANLLAHAVRLIQAHLACEVYLVELTRRGDAVTYPFSGSSRTTGARAGIVCTDETVAHELQPLLLKLGKSYITKVTIRKVTQDVDSNKTVTAYELSIFFAPVIPSR